MGGDKERGEEVMRRRGRRRGRQGGRGGGGGEEGDKEGGEEGEKRRSELSMEFRRFIQKSTSIVVSEPESSRTAC